ncbi:MAG: dockerin type I domain-containing protein [Pirellula sp.]
MVVIRHNHAMPTDVNMDGNTSPLDVLSIINELNPPELAPAEAMMSDTHGDGSI